jgi:hypothetical protein
MTPEAYRLTTIKIDVVSAAYIARTTPKKMRACIEELGISVDAKSEFNLTALLYAVRLKMDPHPPRYVPPRSMRLRAAKLFGQVARRAFAPR